MVDNIATFGDKELFAIQFKSHRTPYNFYLRLWFNNYPIGDFKKPGSCDYIVNSYFKLIKALHDPVTLTFEDKTDKEIFDDVVLDISEKTLEEENRFIERMNTHTLNFGVYQFLQYSFIFFNVIEEGKLKFLIYEMDGETEPKLHSYKVDTQYFLSVYKQFLRFANENSLKKRTPFFPDGFSYGNIA